ncbi:hypothetical protein ONZ45_g19169 [Pleurotus djamor]|nr:hypothetical protein ONZ45_g19169 [Pleurotus djamor]
MNKDQPVRRPLPDVPVSANAAPQRPNTPVHGASSTPIPANSFYSAASQPPPLPLRPKKPGSANTSANLTALQSAPPYTSYHNDIALNGFREPELVTDDDKMPELLPMQAMNEWETSTQWDWNDSNRGWSGTGDWATDDNAGYRSSSVYTKPVAIDGWDAEEERLWWDPAIRDQHRRPGPGILPPLLAEKMHNPDHTLYSVSVKPPDYKPIETPATQVKADGRVETSTPSSSPPPVHRSSSTAPSPPQPTEDDVRTSVPHPNAYYCPKDNGWVILQWKSSAVLPPLASSFSWPHPLPDQDRRKATVSCLREQDGGNSNKTHHFHHYPRAIDSLKLTPPFRHTPWQVEESIKQKRRAAFIPGDIDMNSVNESAAEELPPNPEEEGELLDLYMCCQCSLYCVSSGVIPGVIPRKYFEEFIKEKKASPPPGKSPEISIGNALDTIIMVIENRLWKGENRMLRVTRPGFTTKLGWSAVTKKVFATLGFIDELLPGEDSEPALRPPATDVVSPQGRENRAKLLRAWVELSAWVAIFRRINAPALKDHRCFALSVTVDSAREMYQTAIGAHPDQITRGNMPDTLQPIMQSLPWDVLGMTMTSYSPELLMFAYFAQCRCDPSGTVTSFSQLAKIATIMEENHLCPPELQDLLMNERSQRQRFTESDVLEAAGALGFGSDGPLKVDFDNDIPSEFIENAWKDCIQRSWIDPRGSQVQTEATEALRILAEARGDQQLHRLWEDKKDRLMDPAKAYSTIEVPNDVEDAMLITIFGIRIDEQPSQAEKMREALTVIAEIRGSERLRRYLETGTDPGEIVAPTRPDIPRGLNQLGNTCYLNSLLQYFYTIRDLRDTVIQMGQLYSKTLEEDKLTDDDLKQHRVGGRLVTRREVFRSKKFIKQLADLFVDMECSETPSVTPTIELAKLALVTSRDEEEDEADKGGTESSNDTDATLVEDGPSRFMSEPPRSPSPSPSSILGKRTRGSNTAMDVDSPSSSSTSPIDADKESFVTPPSRRSSSIAGEASGSSARSPVDRDGDVMMAGPPTTSALANKKSEPTSDSTMMFGKRSSTLLRLVFVHT